MRAAGQSPGTKTQAAERRRRRTSTVTGRPLRPTMMPGSVRRTGRSLAGWPGSLANTGVELHPGRDGAQVLLDLVSLQMEALGVAAVGPQALHALGLHAQQACVVLGEGHRRHMTPSRAAPTRGRDENSARGRRARSAIGTVRVYVKFQMDASGPCGSANMQPCPTPSRPPATSSLPPDAPSRLVVPAPFACRAAARLLRVRVAAPSRPALGDPRTAGPALPAPGRRLTAAAGLNGHHRARRQLAPQAE